ncbi:MAG: AraC family ligand binding domain-containing protein, partial [Planctomycetes bacterium]|nr:AraC family ligand binding domain-containing protein [Planctomycetota bacterium]
MATDDHPRLPDRGVHPPGTSGRWVSCERGGVLAKAGVVCLGMGGNVPGYRIERPLSLDHIVIITTAGEGWLDAGDGRRCVGMGSIVLLPAGGAHAYGVDRGSWQLVWLHIDGRRRLPGLPTRAVIRPIRSTLASAIAGLAEEHAG